MLYSWLGLGLSLELGFAWSGLSFEPIMVNKFPVSASEAGAVGLSTSEEGVGIPEFQSEVKPTSTESA